MILNIITFFACFLMLIFFRKIDKSNVKMNKLRRFSSKMFDEFSKLVEVEKRKFRDSTIEMDILIKKSNTLTINLAESLREIENRLEGLNLEKANLKRVEDDIKIISQAAKDVNKQIEFIALAKEDFGNMTNNISFLAENISNAKQESKEIIQNFNNRVRERSIELSDEFTTTVDELRESLTLNEDRIISESEQKIIHLGNNFTNLVSELEHDLTQTKQSILESFKNEIAVVAKSVEGAKDIDDQLQNMKTTLSDLESNVFSEIKEKSFNLKNDMDETINSFSEMKDNLIEKVDNEITTIYSNLNERGNELKNDISNSVSEFNLTKSSLLNGLEIDIEKVSKKLNGVEENVNDSKTKLIVTFQEEVDRIRTELDNLNLHAITKKDEIVQATRREAEDIRKKIETFEEKYIELENRLVDTAESKMDHLDSEYSSIELRFHNLSEQLLQMKTEIINYEESNKIFTKTDDLKNEVSKAIDNFQNMIVKAESESQGLDKFLQNVNDIKDIKKSVEKEIRIYQSKKNHLEDIEGNMKGLLEMNDIILIKSDDLEQKIKYVNNVEKQISSLHSTYSDLNSHITELLEHDDRISSNLASIHNTDEILNDISDKTKVIEKTFSQTDRRVNKINKHLEAVEEKTLVLKSREIEIQELRDKFDDIENVSDLTEQKVAQVYAMFKKVNELKEEIDQTDTRLQTIYNDTDRKMKEFVEFVKTIDNNSPISREIDPNALPDNNINKNIINTIRDLSDKGWNPEAIAKQLMMDENSVRLIINTQSM